VANVKYPHAIFEHSVEDFVGIPDKRNDVHARPLDDPRGGVRARRYMRYNLTNAAFDGGNHASPNTPLSADTLRRSAAARLLNSTFIRGGTT
jgi:hypothetical protein